jgi:cell division protein FtsL
MATLANMYSWLFERSAQNENERPHTATAHSSFPMSGRVRAFANEDIYFFVKRIDNSGVVRQADVQARGMAWKLIGSVGVAVILLIGVLLPGAYSLLAGYQIQVLKQEQARLINEQSSLEIEASQLLTPARMEQLAKEQLFIDPPSQKVVYLDSKGGSLALNAAMNPK